MTKKAALIRLTILLLAWQKRLKGRLKEYFHCLTKTFFISFGSMIFTYSSNHWLSETFLIQRKFFTCIKTYCNHIISIHALCFLCLPLSPATNKYTFGFNLKNFSVTILPVSSFTLPMTNSFETLQYFSNNY